MRFETAALLFDMDGTLIDSTPSVNRCWGRLLREYAVPAERLVGILMHGRPGVEILADLLPPHRVQEAAQRLQELELADADGTVVLPGVLRLLASLPGDAWAVVTSANAPLAEARLKVTGLQPPVLVSADDVTRGKPDPEPFLRGAALLGVPAERCLVLEDAPAGLAAARAAGMRTIAVTTTHTADELDADWVLPDLRAVRAEKGGDGLSVWLDETPG